MKVLFVHSSATGAGHRSAADSVIEKLADSGVEAESFDTLTLSSQRLIDTQKSMARGIWKVPGLVKWSYESALRGCPLVSTVQSTLMAIKAHLSPLALDHIQQAKPDLIVSTQGEVNGMLHHWTRQGQVEAPIWTILTDHKADSRWTKPSVERYFVANEAMVGELERLGVEGERVTVSGIPVKSNFANTAARSSQQLRQQLGLDPDLPTALITGGGVGAQPFVDLVKALGQHRFPMQTVCITAANSQAREQLTALKSPYPVHAEGRVNNMEEWMRASDVIVTKAGGLTTSEALALGKPMVIHRPGSGLAIHNATRLQELGVAEIGTDSTDTAARAVSLLKNPESTERAQQVGKPRAAETIAAAILTRLN